MVNIRRISNFTIRAGTFVLYLVYIYIYINVPFQR